MGVVWGVRLFGGIRIFVALGFHGFHLLALALCWCCGFGGVSLGAVFVRFSCFC